VVLVRRLELTPAPFSFLVAGLPAALLQDPDDETDIAPDEITELAREAGVYDVAVDLISSDVQQTEHWRECSETYPLCSA